MQKNHNQQKLYVYTYTQAGVCEQNQIRVNEHCCMYVFTYRLVNISTDNEACILNCVRIKGFRSLEVHTVVRAQITFDGNNISDVSTRLRYAVLHDHVFQRQCTAQRTA